MLIRGVMAVVVAVAASTLGGFAANTAAATTPEESGDGVVVVSVSGNSGDLQQLQALVLRPVVNGVPQEGRTYTLDQVSTGMARDTALFIGPLPRGQYSLYRLLFPGGRPGIRDKYVDPQKSIVRPGLIEIQANRLNDLGRLVLTAVNSEVILGRSAQVRDNRELVQRFSADNAHFYDGPESSGWAAPPDPSDVAETYALAHPVGAFGLTELDNGQVVAASRLGSILLREAPGHWSAARTGRLQTLLTVASAPSPTRLLLAGGEFDALWVMDRDHRFQPVTTDILPPGNIIFVSGTDALGWFIALQTEGDVLFFATPSLDTPAWTELAREHTGSELFRAQRTLWAWPTPTGFGYALNTGKIAVYDASRKTWLQHSSPGESSIKRVRTGVGTSLGVVTQPSGPSLFALLSRSYVSNDFGGSWTEMRTPFNVHVAAPVIGAGGTIYEPGTAEALALFASHDGGNTWASVCNTYPEDDELVATPSQGLFRYNAGKSGLFLMRHSDDGGIHWTSELTNFDRRFAVTPSNARRNRKKRAAQGK